MDPGLEGGVVASQIGSSLEPFPEVKASPLGHGGWSDLAKKHQEEEVDVKIKSKGKKKNVVFAF